MSNIGVLHMNGFGVPQDYGEALKWFRKAARLGNTYAQTWLRDNGLGW